MARTLRSFAERVAWRRGLELRERRIDIPLDRRTVPRVMQLTRMLERVSGVPGAIVECGVALGESLLMFSILSDREIYGFDSFEGFPEPSSFDTGPAAVRGRYAGISTERVDEMLRRCGRPVTLVKGFFEQTVPGFSVPIALLHLDCDLYESYRVCLEHLVPLVEPGGLILFDEYEEPKWPGATKAIDEWRVDREVQRDPESGKAFVLVPAASAPRRLT